MKIIEMSRGYQAGATLKEIASRYGVHRTTVSSILKKEGVQIRNQSLGPEAIASAVELYRSGLSLAMVGSKLSCDASTVRLVLLRSGVALRDQHGQVVNVEDRDGLKQK
jgi:lambda repressor-like predicted transcriptional regulator